jgi:hypothetical protein
VFDIKDTKGLMYCILWVTTVLGCLLSNTQTGQRPEDTTRVNIDGGVDKEGNQIAGYQTVGQNGFSFD